MRLGKEYIGNESSHACAEWQLTSVRFVIIFIISYMYFEYFMNVLNVI